MSPITLLLFFCLACLVTAQNWRRAGTTRYWDCSKPHCAWKGKIPDTSPPFSHDYAFKRCNGRCAMGAQFYGTAAASTSIMGGSNQAEAACAKCYALRAVGTSTPQVILQVNNLCPGDSNPACRRDHFDIAVPGFDFNEASVSNTCRQVDPAVNYVGNEQPCMRAWDPRTCDCNRVSSDPKLVEGCRIFSELGWNNQEVDFTEVECPNLAGAPVSPPAGSPPSGGGSPPPPPPSNNGGGGASCGSVSSAGDANNQYWVEVNAPSGSNVRVRCSNQEISCTEQWGKFVCRPNGPCPTGGRVAIVNGQQCSLGGGGGGWSAPPPPPPANNGGWGGWFSPPPPPPPANNGGWGGWFSPPPPPPPANNGGWGGWFSPPPPPPPANNNGGWGGWFPRFWAVGDSNEFTGSTTSESMPKWSIVVIVIASILALMLLVVTTKLVMFRGKIVEKP